MLVHHYIIIIVISIISIPTLPDLVLASLFIVASRIAWGVLSATRLCSHLSPWAGCLKNKFVFVPRLSLSLSHMNYQSDA